MIWTTTPWTLPANLGIMVKEDFTYLLIEFEKEERREWLLVLDNNKEYKLLRDFCEKTGWRPVQKQTELTNEYALPTLPSGNHEERRVHDRVLGWFIGYVFSGEKLNKSLAWHPFLNRESRVITSNFVTDDTGTGQVHTAPGHGMEDYIAGRENGLGLISPVDDDGNFTDEVGLPDLVGKNVFAANEPIIALLTASGHLLGREKYVHQYPHCWRSKLPIIFRSVPQFFLRLDRVQGESPALTTTEKKEFEQILKQIPQLHYGTDSESKALQTPGPAPTPSIRELALTEIDTTQWLPPWGRNRIYGTVESRPDWCISRQRTWGVPLPVFYKEDGEAVLDSTVARKVADLVEQHGTNVWFEKTDAELCALLGLPDTWTKGKDTLDVWIDSGCSSIAVTEARPEYAGNEGIADLYIEATDQHRGWFQSSLMCSVIHRGKAPYKAVMTHGFVTDTSGAKISKSGDKPINAEHYYNKYGADLVRLWVSSVDWTHDVPFSDKLFEQNGEVYRRFRNTLRILLANLGGFDAGTQSVHNDQLTVLDRWILERLHAVTTECLNAYAVYDFRKVFITLNQFCAVDLSALYVDISKDRMYCDALDSPRRRSAQTAMHRVLDSLCRLLAPILAFTADEAWEFAGHQDSIHEHDFPIPDPAFAGSTATQQIAELQKLRDVLMLEVDKARKEKLIGSNLEASAILEVPAGSPAAAALAQRSDAEEFFILSDLQIQETATAAPVARVTRTSYKKCLRCWRHLPGIGQNTAHPDLCVRCAGVLA